MPNAISRPLPPLLPLRRVGGHGYASAPEGRAEFIRDAVESALKKEREAGPKSTQLICSATNLLRVHRWYCFRYVLCAIHPVDHRRHGKDWPIGIMCLAFSQRCPAALRRHAVSILFRCRPATIWPIRDGKAGREAQPPGTRLLYRTNSVKASGKIRVRQRLAAALSP